MLTALTIIALWTLLPLPFGILLGRYLKRRGEPETYADDFEEPSVMWLERA